MTKGSRADPPITEIKDNKTDNKETSNDDGKNKKKTIRTGTRNLRPGTGGQRRRFNGEEYFTFSLDGLIPAYGDPSQVKGRGKNMCVQ